MMALQWLKDNNPLYNNIQIVDSCEENFDMDEEENNLEESGVVRCDMLQPEVDVQDFISNSEHLHRKKLSFIRSCASPSF